MGKNSIDQICAVEAEAARTKKEAVDAASDILAKADVEAQNLVSSAQDAAREAARVDLAAAHDANRLEMEKLAVVVSAEVDTLREAARAVQPEAVKKIIQALA